MENDAEIFPAHYTIKVTEKGLKMASMIYKLAMWSYSWKIKLIFCQKSLCNLSAHFTCMRIILGKKW
jgi:hypothetical protein